MKPNLIGVQKLLDTLGKKHPKYCDVVNFQSRLLDNYNYVSAYGDSENYRVTRNEIIDQINRLATETIQKTLYELSKHKPVPIQIKPNSPRYKEAIWREFQEPEMSLILPGPFIMGSHPMILDPKPFPDEYPLHVVNLQTFYIATTAVTNLQYAIFVLETGYDRPESWQNRLPSKRIHNHPVVDISWFDAIKFCNWLRELTEKPYRLPTEAEWEKAARGVNAQLFPWGNQWEENCANTNEYSGYKSVAVNEFPKAKSPYDVLNMAGNVYEWTSSLWGSSSGNKTEFPYPYTPGDGREALDAPLGILRIIRGGAFSRSKRHARCACRDKLLPTSYRPDVGFRLALSV
ncbi:MAG: formylglycine-generating enzyme family protein [Pleurocapsa sp. MO_226.B13]|nr:formylglycine-generating enzyme family protein [Pleurocapsa sp. MO_226.B13]